MVKEDESKSSFLIICELILIMKVERLLLLQLSGNQFLKRCKNGEFVELTNSFTYDSMSMERCSSNRKMSWSGTECHWDVWMLQGGAYTNNRNFVNQPQQQQQQQVQVVQRQSPGQQLPPVRSLTSPGARGSPFSPEGQYPRLTRTISAPPPAPHATTQLPGNPPISPRHACQ